MTENTPEDKTLNPYSIASGLIYKDRSIIPLLYLLIILPHLAAFFISNLPSYSLLILERTCQLAFLTIITVRWIRSFKQSEWTPGLKQVIKFFLTGYIVWLAVIIPFLLQVLGEIPGNISGLSFILIIPAIYLLNKYFFYFFPVLLGYKSAFRIMESSLNVNKTQSGLPIKTLLAPLGLFSLAVGSMMAFSPDGRSFTVNLLVSLLAGIFWFLHCYISLAACLLYWNQKDWHENDLDAYRFARLSSIAMSGPKPLSHILLPKQGLVALGVSLLIWFANMITLETTKPSAEIKLISKQVSGENAIIVLELNDKEYKLRGLQPLHFTLAGEKRAIVCNEILHAKVKGNEDDARFILPESPGPIQLEVQFKCTRDEESMKKLEDLYLWYRGAKLEKVDF